MMDEGIERYTTSSTFQPRPLDPRQLPNLENNYIQGV